MGVLWWGGAISKFMWLLIRWTGTWAPLLQYCNAWTHFSSNKIQRNCMGPKITTYMPSWGQILDKRYKNTKKLNCHLKKKSLEAKQGSEQKHGPCTHHHLRGAQTPQPPLRPNSWAHPYPHPIETASSPFGKQASKGSCCLFSPRLHAATGAPLKSCLNFLVWPLINFY